MAVESYAPLPAVDRRFWAVLAGSLLLHAVAVFVHRTPVPPPVERPPLMASLRLPAPVAPASPTSPSLAPKRPQPIAQKPTASPKPRAPVLAMAPSAASSPTIPSAPLPVASEAAPIPAKVVTAPPPLAEPVAPRIDLLASYRDRLSTLFASQQEYPRVAAMRGWEGDVMLRVKVARKGNLIGVQVDRSSGFEVLDRHAVAMIERLNTFPPLPEGLEGGEIQVVVPVHFKLRKAT